MPDQQRHHHTLRPLPPAHKHESRVNVLRRPPSPERPSRNAAALGAALDAHRGTTSALKHALATVESAKVVATDTAGTLDTNREKMKVVDARLDDVETELSLARTHLCRLTKRVYTDRVFIALAFLLAVGVIAIIVYAAVHPGQSIFRVPDAVRPPLPAAPPSPGPGRRLRGADA
jgi:hypothetical protein